MPAKEKLTVLKSIIEGISNTQLFGKFEKIRLRLEESDSDLKSLADSTKDLIEELNKEVSELTSKFNEFYKKEFCDNQQETCDNKENNEKNENNEVKVINGEEKIYEGENTNDLNEENGLNDLESDESKAYIRCVDISKLLDKSSNSTDKNSSVIVLSDSDSSPVKLPTSVTLIPLNKKSTKENNNKSNLNNHKNRNESPTKGVLKTSNSKTKSNETKTKKNVRFSNPEATEIDDLEKEPPQSSRLPRKTKPIDLHDISSLSEDATDSTSSDEISHTSKKKVLVKRGRKIRSGSPIPGKLSSHLDEKMTGKCFVPLARIHPDVLLRYYEKLQLKNEIKRLTNMHSLKRNRKGRKQQSDSSSSDSSSTSDNHQNQPKRAKTTPKKSSKVSAPSDSSSSSSSSTECETPKDVKREKDVGLEKIIDEEFDADENDEEMVENLLQTVGNELNEDLSEDESVDETVVKKDKVKRKKEVEKKEVEKEEVEMEQDGENGEDEEKGNVEEEENEDEDGKKVDNEKSKWRRDKLLTENLSNSDSEDSSVDLEKAKSNEENPKKKSKDKVSSEIVNDDIVDELNSKDKSNDTSNDTSNNELLTAQSDNEQNNEENEKEDDENNLEDKVEKEVNEEKKKQEKSVSKDTEEKGNKKVETKKKSEENSNSESSKIKNSSSDSDSDVVSSKKAKGKKKEENDDESDESFAKFYEKSQKLMEKSNSTEVPSPKKPSKRLAKKLRRIVVNSDSDSASSQKKEDSSDSDSNSSKSKDCDKEDEKEEDTKPTKKRRRIKNVNDSSDEDGDDKSTRKQIRKVLTRDSLAETTIAAEKEEAERKARILERQKKYNQIFEPDSLEKSTVDKVVLDFEEDQEILIVHKDITKHLKPHQAKGIQFMWDTCFESVERAQKEKGSGCILAHCMGLGKTLQVITLVHTLLTNQEKTKIEKVLIVCPLSTVLNWVAEFKKWLPDEDEINVFDIVQFKQNHERLFQVKEWDRCGGALVLGYDMFRNLTNPTGKRMSKKLKQGFYKYLVDPGPDLVICDEGHLLKNEKTSLSIAMNKLKTARRIVLTGTPLQNNLKEYWCMVQFVKPNLLGTYKEYLNRFVNPIVNGQYTDSTQHDIQLMRKRSHVLHKLLDGVVQRRDYAVLAPFLPPKYEYVLFVALTEKQIQLYRHYMKEKARRPQEGTGRSSFLFVDFQELQRICTHPRVLLDKSIENKIAREKKEWDDESEGSLKDFIDDGSDKSDTTNSSSSSDSDSDSGSNDSSKKKKTVGRRRVTRATAGQISESDDEPIEKEPDPLEWWREFVTDEDLDDILISGKLSLLFEILGHCENIGDKVLIFSQSLYSLNVIEYFLAKVDDATQNSETGSYCGFSGSWSLGLDYFRLDGSSSADNRAAWCNTFNNPENVRARLFLISTRAGGLGINLVAANRVIIFDVSWNPSHDTQSIYRVYRFGQNKPSYIYRFVTLGTMEMKIYERQVIKQAISKRVIDEQQIDRHYNQNDIAELYKFEPKPEAERPIPLVPVDVLLGELLQQDHKIYKYHEHQSLLENKVDEVLDEAERKAAWEEFENEKKARQFSGSINHIPIPSIAKALASIIARETPALTPEMVQQLVPTMLLELQEKLATGDNQLYNKVLNEIRLMQATAQQQRIEEYYRMQQQQQQNLLLQQYQQQLLANPMAAAQLMNQWSQQFNQMAGISSGRGRPPLNRQQTGNINPFSNIGNLGPRLFPPKNSASTSDQSNVGGNQQTGNKLSSNEVIELND